MFTWVFLHINHNVHLISVLSRDSDLELTDNEEDFHYTEVTLSIQQINTMTKSFAAMNTQSSPPVDSHTDRRRHISDDRPSDRRRHVSEDSGSHSCGAIDKVIVEGQVSSETESSGGRGVMDHDYQRKVIPSCVNISIALFQLNLRRKSIFNILTGCIIGQYFATVPLIILILILTLKKILSEKDITRKICITC